VFRCPLDLAVLDEKLLGAGTALTQFLESWIILSNFSCSSAGEVAVLLLGAPLSSSMSA
jgi:hypothetical protein